MKEKLFRLKAFWQGLSGPCAIGFSGGVDSAFVLASANRWAHVPVYPLLAVSCLLPPFTKENAKRISKEVGVPLIQFSWQPLAIYEITRNDGLRCYFCKKNMYLSLIREAKKLDSKCHIFLDGTHFDDLSKDRPGLQALEELDIKTPLAEVGFTKKEIRSTLKKWGYTFWNVPSQSCLATRFEPGTKLDGQALGALYFELKTKKANFF